MHHGDTENTETEMKIFSILRALRALFVDFVAGYDIVAGVQGVIFATNAVENTVES
jgi:hypothetical protein